MRWLWAILLIKAILLGVVIGEGTIGLSPDEAQYWSWSQELDWGYYSKPPGIAWQIWLTTALFGNHPFGVRVGALLIGFFLSVAVYQLAMAVGVQKKTALWAGVVMVLSPLGFYLSFAATTDGGAILFMTLAAWAVMRGPYYLLAGLCILLGALFKWTAFLFWPIILPLLFIFKPLRQWKIVGGIALSLLALLPSLYWNQAHEWATFKHVTTAVASVKAGNFGEFLIAQIGLLSPIYFVLLVISYFYIRKKPSLWVIAAFPALVLVYLVLSFAKRMQPNWAAYLYPIGLTLVPWLSLEQLKKGALWLYIGTALSLLMILIAFMIPWLPLPYSANPFRQSLGWQNLAPALTQAGYQPDNDFLFSDKYQNVSILSFYAPEQKRAYYFNISRSRKTQFSYWPQMEDREIGHRGFFVVIENKPLEHAPWYIEHYTKALTPYFRTVQFKGSYPLYSTGEVPVKFALILEGIDYNGKAPPGYEKY